MKNTDIFESQSIPKAVASLAVPTILSMLVMVFYNMADTFFVGQTGDANQVAAVSLAMPVFLFIMAVGNIFGVGGSSYISRCLGEGKMEEVKKTSSFCFYGGIASAIAIMIAFFLFVDKVLISIGADENTFTFAKQYLLYIACGAVFNVIGGAFGNIIRAEGAAKVSMTGMMLGTIVNIVLDPIMILTLKMGVAGAAIATVIGNMCTVVYYLFYFRKGTTMLSISRKHFAVTKRIVKNVFAIGIPASLNNVLMSCSNIILNMLLVSYGNSPVAGMGVAMKANMLVIFVQMGLAMGIQPLVGYCYGSKNTKRLSGTMKFAAACNIVMGTVLTVIYYFAADGLVRMFIEDAEVIKYGSMMLRALMVSGPFIGILFVFSFSFQGMGQAFQALILSVSRQGLMFLPIAIIGNKMFGLQGVIYAQPIADIASLVVAIIMFVQILAKMRKNHEMEA
ncbi:MAG: MATE family efflux transporter [Firmicutes bacterium]|nr:MATE family efflux transporter [Bacillota bacterium]